jgi:type II secretory pathway component PulF
VSADQVKAWAAVEAKGAEAAAADVANMVAGQPRGAVVRMLTSMFDRSIRMRQALELIANQPTDIEPMRAGHVKAIARRALEGE